jgi:hypothetical protein
MWSPPLRMEKTRCRGRHDGQQQPLVRYYLAGACHSKPSFFTLLYMTKDRISGRQRRRSCNVGGFRRRRDAPADGRQAQILT